MNQQSKNSSRNLIIQLLSISFALLIVSIIATTVFLSLIGGKLREFIGWFLFPYILIAGIGILLRGKWSLSRSVVFCVMVVLVSIMGLSEIITEYINPSAWRLISLAIPALFQLPVICLGEAIILLLRKNERTTGGHCNDGK